MALDFCLWCFGNVLVGNILSVSHLVVRVWWHFVLIDEHRYMLLHLWIIIFESNWGTIFLGDIFSHFIVWHRHILLFSYFSWILKSKLDVLVVNHLILPGLSSIFSKQHLEILFWPIHVSTLVLVQANFLPRAVRKILSKVSFPSAGWGIFRGVQRQALGFRLERGIYSLSILACCRVVTHIARCTLSLQSSR